MAPPLSAELAHRADLTVVTGAAASDLLQAWPQPTNNPVDTLDWLMQTLPDVVDTYGTAASTLGADYYDQAREAAGTPGRFTAITAELPDMGRTDSLARWGLANMFHRGADPSSTVDLDVAQTKVTGGLQRIIANADRQTVIASATADPKAIGYKRVGLGGACDFCQRLIDYGRIYKSDSKSSGGFESHDFCHCVAVPVWYANLPR